MFPQGDDEVAIRTIESAFEAANEGKDVEVIVYPEEEYQTKISTSLVAGNPPDVAIMENRNWMKFGFAVDLTEHVGDWGVGVDDYSPGGLARGTTEGDPSDGLYGIGTFLGGFTVVYNKAFFDEAGLAYPSPDESMTFAEYADLCRQLTKPSEDPTQTVYGCTVTIDPFKLLPEVRPGRAHRRGLHERAGASGGVRDRRGTPERWRGSCERHPGHGHHHKSVRAGHAGHGLQRLQRRAHLPGG